MAVPKKKTSKSKKGMRRSHLALKRVNYSTDSTTGEYKLPHHVSLEDGYYKDNQVVFENNDNAESDSEAKA